MDGTPCRPMGVPFRSRSQALAWERPCPRGSSLEAWMQAEPDPSPGAPNVEHLFLRLCGVA